MQGTIKLTYKVHFIYSGINTHHESLSKIKLPFFVALYMYVNGQILVYTCRELKIYDDGFFFFLSFNCQWRALLAMVILMRIYLRNFKEIISESFHSYIAQADVISIFKTSLYNINILN